MNRAAANVQKTMIHFDFDDKNKQPDDTLLTKALGPTKELWDEFIHHIAREYEPVTLEWGFYKAWSLRLKSKKRTIVYLIPQIGSFICAYVLGGKATEEARRADLPKAVLKIINEAKVYAEGRGFRLEVKNKQDLETIKRLASIKMAN
jgi:hypothetical protein